MDVWTKNDFWFYWSFQFLRVLRPEEEAAGALAFEAFSWLKSRRTVLLHLGHLGSSCESITYMRQRGHPTRTIEVVSGLDEYLTDDSSWFISEETHELGGEVGEVVAERLGDRTILLRLDVGGERFSLRSTFGLLRLIFCVELDKKIGSDKKISS